MSKQSINRGPGYLQIDHRDSPGIAPADVAHMQGRVEMPVCGPGQVFEADVFTCGHCQRAVLAQRRLEDRRVCRKCMRYLCGNPSCVLECNPIEKQFDVLEQHLQRFIGREDDPAASQLPSGIILTDKE